MSDFQHYYEELADEIVEYVNSKPNYSYLSYSDPVLEYIRDNNLLPEDTEMGVVEGIMHACYLLGQQSVE